jgi:hypothetical protein
MLFGGSMFILEAFGGGTNPSSSRMNDYAPVLGFLFNLLEIEGIQRFINFKIGK